MSASIGDQTQNFFAAVNATRNNPTRYHPNVKPPQTNYQYQQQISQDLYQFISNLKKLNHALSLVREKYRRLHQITTDRTLFNDISGEINRLTQDIQSNLDSIGSKMTEYRNQLQQQYPSQQQQQSHLYKLKLNIINDVSGKIATLAKSLANTLKLRTNIINEKNKRKDQYGGISTNNFSHSILDHQSQLRNRSDANNNSMYNNNNNNTMNNRNNNNNNNKAFSFSKKSSSYTALMDDIESEMSDNQSDYYQERQQQYYNGGGNNNNNNNNNHSNSGSDIALPSFASLVDQTMDHKPQYSASMIDARAQGMDALQATAHEVMQLYTTFNEIVHQQEEVVLRIDANIEEATMNIDGANDEIMSFYNSARANQWLLLKIFAVIIIFAILFVTIIS